MAYQYDEATDERLDACAVVLEDAAQAKAAAEKSYAKAFEEVFRLFNSVVGVGRKARYVAATGKVVERRVSEPEPRLDPAALETALCATPEGAKLWRRIARPTAWEVDVDALTRLVKTGKVAPETVESAMTTPKPVVSRWYRPPSKDDALWLRMKGVHLSPQMEALADAEEGAA